MYNEGGDDDEMEGEEDNDVDAVQLSQFSSQCLLSFKVENNTNLTKVIELQITPAVDDFGLPVPLNFRCPVSTIPCQVFANHSTAIVHLTKLDANIADWGAFSWSFTIQDKLKSQYAGMNSGQGSANNTWATNGNNGDLEPGMAQDDAYNTNYAADEKACPSCTYLNPAHYSLCEVCQSTL